MDDTTVYETERQKTIAENRALLDSLGLDQETRKIEFPKPSKPAPVKRQKRKSENAIQEEPRRRSGRIAGLDADGDTIKAKIEEEEKEREVIRIINRKEREQVMELGRMVEDASEEERLGLDSYLSDLKTEPRENLVEDHEISRLKSAFKGMSMKANAKVTPERVYAMQVHPERTKTLVLVGDKAGMLGMWDALGQSEEKVKDEDDTQDVKEPESNEGRIWHVQAHARSSITAIKVDPVNGSGLYTSSYDCSLRHISFESLKSTEIFAFGDDDTLITHFDLAPTGQEAWISDKNGGISHCDFRTNPNARRRWIVQDEGRAAKLGGISVNPTHPHLLVTAGNDQHLRIWDTRHLTSLNPRSTESSHAPESKNNKKHINTSPESIIPSEKITRYMETSKGQGLLRASFQHGKSCSAAYWDPWGKRILTTSYDDKLRVWSLGAELESEGQFENFKPSKIIPHNCQTGRWLTILRAQWSQNKEFAPHFTVGNMKRSLDVVASNGESICKLWTDGVTAVPAVTASHPSRVDHVLGANTSGRVQLWTSDTSS